MSNTKNMNYVDGFVIVIPKKNLRAYKKMAEEGREMWMSRGALEYFECVGDDMKVKWALPFPKRLKLKPSETVIFSWIVYKSKKDRDRINANIMKDMQKKDYEQKNMPFDMKKMSYGGFKVIVKN